MSVQRRTFVAQLAVAFAAAGTVPFMASRSAAQGTPKTHTVRIARFVFAPRRLNVSAGDTIRWINRDIVPHTATADDESWDTGEMKPGQTGEIRVRADMTLTYFCRFHPAMKASLRIN